MSRDNCSVSGCVDIASRKGYCAKHYTQVYRHGRVTPEREKFRYKKCLAGECDNKPTRLGYCGKHYKQLYRTKKVGNIKECSVEGCVSVVNAKGLCSAHYRVARILSEGQEA